MPWTWRYEKADGTPVAADDLQEAIFVSQGDAESWLGENWRALGKYFHQFDAIIGVALAAGIIWFAWSHWQNRLGAAEN